MGIVLSEGAHTGEAVKLARLLIAIYGAKLSTAEWQLTIRAWLRSEYLTVVRTVHRFEHILLILLWCVDRLEGVLTVVSPVARGNVEVLGTDMGSDNLLIAETLLNGAQHLLQTQTEVGALWQPYRQTLTHTLREHEEFHLLAYLAMVTFLSLLKHDEVFVEHLLLREGDAIETLQLCLAGIATPEGACDRGELDSLDDTCRNDMRSFTKVGEVALGVGGDRTILEVLVDVLHLILLSLCLELCYGISLSHFLTHYGFVLASQFKHLILYLLEVALLDHLAVRQLNIIEETVLCGRTETKLYAWVELLQCLGEEVGRGVPEGVLAFFVLKAVEGDGSILSDRTVEFGGLTVYATCHAVACQGW